MLATFRVETSFLLKSLGHFVLAGEILDGTVSIGMTVKFENTTFRIQGVEFVDRVGPVTISLVGVVFKNLTEYEMFLIKRQVEENAVVEFCE